MTSPKRNPKISKIVSQTSEEADSLMTLRAKLKLADFEIQNYVNALETENYKLQKQISKLQSENVTLRNRIKIYKENEKPKLTKEQEEKIQQLFNEIMKRTNMD